MDLAESDGHCVNLARYWGVYAVPSGGASFGAGPDFGFATTVNSNIFNPVVANRASSLSALATQAAQLRAMRGGGGVFWWLGPGAQGAQSRAELAGLGLEEVDETPALHCPLAGFRDGPPPQGLRISVVRTRAERSEWARLTSGWFGFPPQLAGSVAAVEARIPAAALAGQLRFIGHLDGQPVASSALVMTAGLAGIYSVATAPDFRRRGLGRAMTAHAMLRGRARGASMSVLQASSMGLPVYQDLGFDSAFAFQCWRQTVPVL